MSCGYLKRHGTKKDYAMLVLTRSKDQTIIIGDDIVIKVIKTKSGSVKLGIEAPRDKSVRRGELPPEPPTTPVERPRPSR